MTESIPETMRAMVFEGAGRPLESRRVAVPTIEADDQVLLRVEACGLCRTDLHIVDGELDAPKLPLIPGHQIVGRVVALGDDVPDLSVGDRVGVPWLGRTDGDCRFCRRGRENLCESAEFTGYTLDGGFAEYARAHAPFCFPLPPEATPLDIAPLLCAGLIGYRTWRLAGGENNTRIGIYGFGAAAHILAQLAQHFGQSVYAFTRPGDDAAQQLARELGAAWTGGSDETPPVTLDAALVFAPVGDLMVTALNHIDRGGQVVSGGIHMSDIPSFPYHKLWEERSLSSVANLTRRDGEEFLALAPRVPIRTTVHRYRLEQVNQALEDLRNGRFTGAAVIDLAA
ncbi:MULTISPECIES: zinc-dependent alcohol dehydrogenase family protein [unclassified Wenzhouxiangella]|uniref:zinc-dependent alcohol dehydrogenase family protein n=1 Tax=unclassified Wenzhouxiangella TaxID=2613841 RepID=UPI001C6ECDD2|nr:MULTISPECIES: zinc-dependent alcohol dehydrogenase family protein [unclassified Wenzhouxiangella]